MTIAKGRACGGSAATLDALTLWAQCAVGGANYSMLDARRRAELLATVAGFESVARDLGEAFEEGDFVLLLEWAHRLLSICYRIEGTNASNAGVRLPDGSHLSWDDAFGPGNAFRLQFAEMQDPVWAEFYWRGTFTPGRWIKAIVACESGDFSVTLEWDTGTGEPSSYLGLPGLTDEVDTSPEARRKGGWVSREALPDTERENS